ncbi:hypothetical protein [Corallibacter sp.]|uniref:hypothetical protein n=1 Tax=Corallibacter sp. TaxID=2038084 RepID=UPI003A94C548
MKLKVGPTFSNVLFYCAFMLLFTGYSFAQQNPIYRLTDGNAQVQGRSAQVIANYPEDLLFNLESSIYIKNNAVLNTYGSTAPKVLKVKDSQSLNFLYTYNELYNEVEMITINLKSLSDLSSPFDVDSIRGFSHLKYIYLKCEFPISESQIRAFIQNADTEISIFYKNINRS